jgi:3-deoxy-D-manno-octulosonic-acid transferase
VSVAWGAYRSLAPLVGAAAPLGRWIAPAAERSEWRERLGDVGASEASDAWIHAASMGEAVAVSGLLAELRRDAPAARLRLTANTRTGRRRLGDLGEDVSLAPLDTPQASERFFARVRPRRLLLLETELWPHWLMAARRARTPVVVLNARLSARSLRRYRWLGGSFRELVKGLAAVLCQSEADRERWVSLGAAEERSATVGNLKNDGLPAAAPDRGVARARLGLDPNRPLWVLGSVRPGEARWLGNAWTLMDESVRARWQVMAVPRHESASAALRREAEQAGITLTRQPPPAGGAWGWDDRPGVLLDYYRAADLAFVGGTLEPYGGHNPLEPAACGAAVLTGPHLEAQAPARAALEQPGGIAIAGPGAPLAAALRTLLGDEAGLRSRAEAAHRAAARARGATRRAVDHLRGWSLWP